MPVGINGKIILADGQMANGQCLSVAREVENEARLFVANAVHFKSVPIFLTRGQCKNGVVDRRISNLTE